MKIFHSEISTCALLTTIKQLRNENQNVVNLKRKLEKDKKRKRQFKKLIEKYKKQAIRLSKLLKNKESGRRSAWRMKDKYPRRHTMRLAKDMKEECQARLAFLDTLGVKVKQISIKDKKR